MVKNVVLVHGAWADGSGWESVYRILKEKGFNVTVAVIEKAVQSVRQESSR